MQDRKRAMVLGAFIADALALGAHWVYNTNVIDRKFGKVDTYHDPLTSYHKGKKAGEHTHYGDQMLVLMESVEASAGFDLGDFVRRWRLFFETYTGYFDHATKDTLQHLSEGKDIHACGSKSDDLAGASRIAPLCYAYDRDIEKLVQTVRQQTAFTHDNSVVVDAAEFFARTAAAVLEGGAPVEAVDAVLKQHFKGSEIETLVADGWDSRDVDTRQALADFGQACSVEAALPGTIHLIARYENDFKAALVENIMAGGDSSARGMLAAMVLGAHHRLESMPGPWLDGLTSKTRIEKLLDNI